MKQSRLAEIRQEAEQHIGKTKSAALIVELCDEIQRLQRRRDATKGPTLSEVLMYAQEIQLNGGQPEKFYDYHQARGWKMGKAATAPMRDWRAALRLWKRNAAPVDGKMEQQIGKRFNVG